MVLKRGHKVRSNPHRVPREKFQRLKIPCPSHFMFKGSMSKIRGQALIVVYPLSFVLVDQDEIRAWRSGAVSPGGTAFAVANPSLKAESERRERETPSS